MSIKVMTQVWATSRMKGSALLLLLAIADHAHDDGGGAYPSVATLADKTRMKERQTRELIAVLERSGELEVERNAGPHGVNLYRVRVSAGVQTSHPALAGTTTPAPQRTSPLRHSAPKPSMNRQLEPSGAQIEENAARPPSEKELRAATKAAVGRLRAEWLEARRKAGLDRYTDHSALRGLEQRIASALGHGTDERDLAAAIAELGRDPKGSPWYVDEKARLAALRREERAHEARKAEERTLLQREDYRRLEDPEQARSAREAAATGLRRLRVPDIQALADA